LKEEIQQRDRLIGEREKKIYDLKKRSQELEKFKFVLDHKIKELKRDIGPREDEIKEMKDKTNMFDQQLKKLNGINTNYGMYVSQMSDE
jgi:cilia- and flagella-associated protein 57